ncbi:MAG: hypothetical protein ACON4O_06680 [Lentimonas sp.]
MKSIYLSALWSLALVPAQAQSGLQPKYDISPAIAKLPEQSDFYGSWTRGDGGYKIRVAASDEGRVVVKYSNPQPINVESAVFEVIDGEPVLQFVLRDEGYPGSNYQLNFYSERRVLVGVYLRPESEPSQVYFVNDKE